MELFAFLAKEYGPIGLLAAWFAWKAHRTTQRVTKLEEWTRKVLMSQLQKNTKAIRRNNELFERLQHLLEPSVNGHADQS